MKKRLVLTLIALSALNLHSLSAGTGYQAPPETRADIDRQIQNIGAEIAAWQEEINVPNPDPILLARRTNSIEERRKFIEKLVKKRDALPN